MAVGHKNIRRENMNKGHFIKLRYLGILCALLLLVSCTQQNNLDVYDYYLYDELYQYGTYKVDKVVEDNGIYTVHYFDERFRKQKVIFDDPICDDIFNNGFKDDIKKTYGFNVSNTNRLTIVDKDVVPYMNLLPEYYRTNNAGLTPYNGVPYACYIAELYINKELIVYG